MKRDKLPQHVGIVVLRHGLAADHPGVKAGVGHFDQPLEIIERIVIEFVDVGVGKAADDQIGLAYAAAPGAEQNPPPPHIQSLARSFGHGLRPLFDGA